MGVKRVNTELTKEEEAHITTWEDNGLGLKKAFQGDGSGRLLWPHTTWQVVALFFAELMGTFMLLFLGCFGGMVPLEGDEPGTLYLQACLNFGFVVAMQITSFGHTSAAHLNPAVSLCALLLGKIRITTFFVYFCAEMIGAVLGVGVLKALTPSTSDCCQFCMTVPHPKITDVHALVVEFIITSMLMFVVNGVWEERSTGVFDGVPMKFAVTIGGLALATGGWTGASMNPARSFAPALWANNWKSHWVYWVGPMAGSLFATLYYAYLVNPEQAKKKYPEEVGLTAIKNETGRQEE